MKEIIMVLIIIINLSVRLTDQTRKHEITQRTINRICEDWVDVAIDNNIRPISVQLQHNKRK